MDKGGVTKGNEADVAPGEGEINTEEQQQPQRGESNRGTFGDSGYYYQQHFSPIPYGYHLSEAQWAAHEHSFQQHGGYQYHPTYGYHYPPQHMEGVPLPPGIPGLGGSTDPLEAVLGRFPCARLRNLPYDVTLENILVLFQGLVVIDVVLHQGDAFVIFANPMDFQMALQRNRQTIGRRFIDIVPASRNEYYEAVAMVHDQERGLKISAAFRDDDILRHSLPISRDIQPSGDTASSMALWGHTTPSPPLHSLSGQSSFVDSMNLGIEFSGARGPGGRELGRSVLHAPPQKRTGGGIQIGEHTGYLRMRGLPFSVGKEDVYKFFYGYNPILESIVLTYRSDGRATGECYIGFETPEDAERAMALHRRSMGNRYIELFISNKEEQSRALARFGNR